VPRFLGFEAKLIPGHVGTYRCPGDGGGLGFGGAILQGPWRRLRVSEEGLGFSEHDKEELPS
jgi:hypothetical protein